MLNLCLAVLALFVVQTFLPNMARAAARDPIQVAYLRGNRDVAPPHTVMSARMERALANMVEAMVLFLPLAVLAVAMDVTGGWAHIGAAVFFFARLAYIPAYGSGVPMLRSLVWAIGHVGLAMMATALLAAAG